MATRVVLTALLITCACIMARCQPGPLPVQSIDIRVLNTESIAIGHIIGFEGSGSAYQRRKVSLHVDEVLKGHPGAQVSITAFASPKSLQQWKAKSSRILVLIAYRKPSLYDWRDSTLDLDNPKLAVSTRHFTTIHGSAELIDYVKAITKEHPGVTQIDMATILPGDDEVGRAWTSASVRSNASPYLEVPADKELEALITERIRARKSIPLVTNAISALRTLKSEANIRLIKGLLDSREYEIERSAEYNNGIELRRFVLREAAYYMLCNWDVSVPEPASHESVDRSATVREINWQGPINEAAYQKLQSFPQLQTLEIFDGGVSRANIGRITSLPNLTTLRIISETKFDDDCVEQVCRMPGLQAIDFTGTAISDRGLMQIAGMKSLRSVRVEVAEVTDAGLARFARMRPDVRLDTKHVQSPIGEYVAKGDLVAVRRYLDKNPKSISLVDSPTKWDLLQKAIVGRAFEMVKLLLDRGAKVDGVAPDGVTPLMTTQQCYNCPKSIVELLIGRGANVNRRDKLGNTALHYAYANFGYQVPLLLALGADPDIRNRQGKTPREMGNVDDQTASQIARMGALRIGRSVLARLTSTRCEKAIYRLATGSIEHWSTKSVGHLTGSLRWSSSPSGRRYLGPFGQQTVTLHLTGLPAHRHIRVEIELFVIGSWDGDGDGAGPDLLDIRIPGVGVLLHSTFFNNTEGERAPLLLQSFPDPYPRGHYKGYTGAAEVRRLGFVQGAPRDAVYRLQFTVADSKPDIDLILTGLTLPQANVRTLADDETWGIGLLQILVDGVDHDQYLARCQRLGVLCWPTKMRTCQ